MSENETYASVWDAISDTPAEAENMKIRSQMMMLIGAIIKENHYTQARAAMLFGVTQPRISDLIRGKIDLFSLDSLVTMLSNAGLLVDLDVRPASAPAPKHKTIEEQARALTLT